MIKINDNWQIDTDQYNVILQRRRVSEKGKNPGTERWENIGYFGSFKHALCELVEQDIKAAESLREVVDRVDKLKDEIMALDLKEFR